MTLAEKVSVEYGWMLAQSLRLCRNRADAEDLAGDAVLKILCNPQNYDSQRPFRPWCSVIILNTYITKFNHNSLVTFTDVETAKPALSDEDASLGVQVSEIWSAIRRCRSRSPVVDCVLMYAGGYSYEEIARYYGIPIGTVRSRINSARKMIRDELENQYVK